MSYPANIRQVVGTNAIGLIWLQRQGFSTISLGNTTSVGGGSLSNQYGLYRGRIAFRWRESGVTGDWYFTNAQGNGCFPPVFPTVAGGDGGSFQDDFRCWQVTLIAAYSIGLAGPASGENGLELGPLIDGYDVFGVGTTAGVRFGPGSAGNVSVQVRQVGGGALTVNQNVAAVDWTDWHAYTVRIIGATSTSDAICRFLLDGNPVLSLGFGAGTLLPSLSAGTARFGWSIAVGNKATGGDAYIAMNGLQVCAAPSEATLS